MITVIDVMRAKNIEITSDLSVRIGIRARDNWMALTGYPPKKELAIKTSGSGSHCFAQYPEDFRPVIESIIEEFEVEEARQGKLAL